MAAVSRRAGDCARAGDARSDGAWIGWAGVADEVIAPFEADGINILPVPLSDQEIEEYYEGFSNDTLWPLYHDVIAPPSYPSGVVGCVPAREPGGSRMRRPRHPPTARWSGCRTTSCSWCPRCCGEARPDLMIGFFNHIPFPPYGIYSQLPWRTPDHRGSARRRRDRFPAGRRCRQLLAGGSPADGFRRRADRSSRFRSTQTTRHPDRTAT